MVHGIFSLDSLAFVPVSIALFLRFASDQDTIEDMLRKEK